MYRYLPSSTVLSPSTHFSFVYFKLQPKHPLQPSSTHITRQGESNVSHHGATYSGIPWQAFRQRRRRSHIVITCGKYAHMHGVLSECYVMYMISLPFSQALPKVTGHMPTAQQGKGVAKLPAFGPERPSPASLQRSGASPLGTPLPHGRWAAAGNSTRNRTRTAASLQPFGQTCLIYVIYILVHTFRVPPEWAARSKARRQCA